MTGDPALTLEDCESIADLIVRMSDQVLSKKRNNGYFALKIDSGPNSNVVTILKNRVSFFISSSGLVDKAKGAKFDPKAVEDRDKYKYQFWHLSLHDLQNNDELFREIVKDSIATIMDRRPHRNPRSLHGHTIAPKGIHD